MNTNEEKKLIVDLINKIKYEVSESQMAELAGCATPLSEAEFVDWHEKIDDLKLGSDGARTRLSGRQIAQLRALMHRIADVTCQIGGRAVRIGKRVIKWIFSLLERYPATVKAFLVMAAIAFVVAHIPLLHYVLLPVVQLAAMWIVGYAFISECVENMSAAPVCND